MTSDAFTRAAAEKHDMLQAVPTREARIALMEIAFRAAGQEHFAPVLYAWAMYANALRQRLADEGIDTNLPAPPYADGRAAGVLALARVWAHLVGPEECDIRDAIIRAGLGRDDPANPYACELTPAGEALRDLGRMLNDRAAHAVRQSEAVVGD